MYRRKDTDKQPVLLPKNVYIPVRQGKVRILNISKRFVDEFKHDDHKIYTSQKLTFLPALETTIGSKLFLILSTISHYYHTYHHIVMDFIEICMIKTITTRALKRMNILLII